MGIVLADTSYVYDTEYFRKGYYDNGVATLSGYMDNSTDVLTNVRTSKLEYGDVTVSFSSISRPASRRAYATAYFYRDGVKKQTNNLQIP